MNNPSGHELAEIGSLANENDLRGDDRLFRALVSGCHIENAAVAAGVSERTAYRRLADPDFRKQLDDARQSLRQSILAKLSDAGHDAIAVLVELAHGSEDDAIRLKAAKALVDSLLTMQRQETEPKRHGGNLSANVGSIAITLRTHDHGGPSLAIAADE